MKTSFFFASLHFKCIQDNTSSREGQQDADGGAPETVVHPHGAQGGRFHLDTSISRRSYWFLVPRVQISKKNNVSIVHYRKPYLEHQSEFRSSQSFFHGLLSEMKESSARSWTRSWTPAPGVSTRSWRKKRRWRRRPTTSSRASSSGRALDNQ